MGVAYRTLQHAPRRDVLRVGCTQFWIVAATPGKASCPRPCKQRQTRRKAGTQSLRSRRHETAGLPASQTRWAVVRRSLMRAEARCRDWALPPRREVSFFSGRHMTQAHSFARSSLRRLLVPTFAVRSARCTVTAFGSSTVTISGSPSHTAAAGLGYSFSPTTNETARRLLKSADQ